MTFFTRLMNKIPVMVLLSGLVLILVPTFDLDADDDDRARTLVIGKVSPNPKKHYHYLKPMAQYVVDQMQDLGIDRVKVLMAKNNRQMARYLRRGKVDWVTETVFSAIEFEQKANAESLLLKHKKGVASYHTVFFARKDSGINSLQDLKGKVITFEDPGSTSGFFIPASILLEAGLELVELDSPRERIEDDAVGYVFAKAEINMSTWVHKGLVDAGAYSNLDWEKEDHNPTSFREGMQLFHQSKPFPRAIEVVRHDLRPEIKQRLKSVLLAAHENPDADDILKAYQKTSRFSELDADVQDGFDRAKNIMSRVKVELDL